MFDNVVKHSLKLIYNYAGSGWVEWWGSIVWVKDLCNEPAAFLQPLPLPRPYDRTFVTSRPPLPNTSSGLQPASRNISYDKSRKDETWERMVDGNDSAVTGQKDHRSFLVPIFFIIMYQRKCWDIFKSMCTHCRAKLYKQPWQNESIGGVLTKKIFLDLVVKSYCSCIVYYQW